MPLGGIVQSLSFNPLKERPDPEQRLFGVYVALLLAVGLLSALIFKFVPSLSFLFIREDALLESATVVLFGLAALLTVGVFASGRRPERGHALVGVLSLLAVLEEISYGQRLFDIPFPVLPNGATFDSLSDLNRVVTIGLDAIGVSWLYVVGATALLILLIWGRALWRFALKQLRVSPLALYVIPALGFALISAFIDTFINPDVRLVLLEEYAEFCIALSLLFAALTGFTGRRQPQVGGRGLASDQPA